MMMVSQVADVLGASLYGDDVLMTGVSKDTRDIHQGDLYVALKGERFDGHQFVSQAASSGAVAALVSDSQAVDVTQIEVADTRIALGQLAAHWRQTLSGKLIGITGSNGKTSVKEMCKTILSAYAGESAVLSTRGNLNNDIGLPMMLLELKQQHRFAIIEMGANHMGEIDYLTTIAKPDIAVLNNAGSAHIEGFGSLENIARGKAEIFNGLKSDGVAVINLDDKFSSFWQEYCAQHHAGNRVITFSMQDEQANVYAKVLTDNHYLIISNVNDEIEQAELTLKVPGKHNVMNALAAMAATSALGISLKVVTEALADFENIEGRLTIKQSDRGCQVIDDSYNANPNSVSAAIDVLAEMKDVKTVLVLGDMAELGSGGQQMHAEIGKKAKDSGIKTLYATGKLCASTVDAFGDNGFYFRDKKKLIAALKKELTGNEVVLVKGSRSAAMEEVVEWLLSHDNNDKRVN